MSNVITFDPYKNITKLLDDNVGKKWLLLFKNEDGQIVFVNNENLSHEEVLMLSKMAEHIIFQNFAHYSGE